MKSVTLNLPTALALIAVVGAGAFAAGQATSPASSPSLAYAQPPAAAPMEETENADPGKPDEPLPPGHPAMGPATAGGGPLPPGHPAVDSTRSMGQGGGAPSDPGAARAADAPLDWKAPARWQSAPNTSSMRIATYRVPRASGDSEDAELSVVQAGGSVEANAQRWLGQFDEGGQKSAKRSVRRVGSLEVSIVDVQGTYSGGMGPDTSPKAGWALRGAIVALPGAPCFFKLTGPAKSVAAAAAEFDALIGSLTLHPSAM